MKVTRMMYLCLACALVETPLLPCQVRLDAVTNALQFQRNALSAKINSVQQLQANIGEKLAKADPAVQNAAQQIPTISVSAQAKAEPVSDSNRAVLLNKIKEFASRVHASETFYSRCALGFVIGTAVLALIGAIFSFARQHVVAGIAGLIVTAMISFSNAYPLNALADFYRTLDSQAASLELDCEVQQPFNADTYNSAEAQLKLLLLAEGQRPGFGNYKNATQGLQTQMQAVKTSFDSVEKTRFAVEALEKSTQPDGHS